MKTALVNKCILKVEYFFSINVGIFVNKIYVEQIHKVFVFQTNHRVVSAPANVKWISYSCSKGSAVHKHS